MDYFIFFGLVFVCMASSFLSGVFVGVRRMQKAFENSSVGHLRIDRSEPDEPPRPFLEIRKGITIDDIAEKNVVMLGVINESYISQK